MAMTEWKIGRTAIGQHSVNIILCDDDPAFLQQLHDAIVRTFSKLNMRPTITGFQSARSFTPEQFAACDIAFLDIDFDTEEHNGIDIARSIRQVNSHALIFFVTNFIDYAPAGYEVQAFRYILKRDLTDVLERYILQAMEHFTEEQEFLQIRSKDESVDHIPLFQALPQ